MQLHRPSDLRLYLQQANLNPKKFLSQHFLIDGNIIDKIIKSSDVKIGESILEIGPGPGVLTAALLKKKTNVIAVEKDRDYVKAFDNWDAPNLQVFEDDFLDFDLEKHIPKNTQVVANIPYHITTPILIKLMDHYTLFSSITLLMQKEVAQRLIAKPNTKQYGSLSIFLQRYADIKYLFDVSENCFYPKPKVKSAVVQIKFKPETFPIDQDFHIVVRKAFQQRRKCLTTSLKLLYNQGKIIQALKDIQFDEKSRPEDLSPEKFYEFYLALKKGL